MSPALVAALCTVVTGSLMVPARARLPAPPRRTLPWGWLVGSAGACLLLVPSSWLAPATVLGAAGLAGRALWSRRRASRRSEERSARLTEVCDLLASELEAGRTPDAALDEAAGLWPELRTVADTCRLGGDVPIALREVARLPGADGLRLLAASWQVSQRLGAGLASSTRRVADAARLDQATRRVVAGELASARATAKLIAALPLLALLVGTGAGGDPWSFLLLTPAGWACLGTGLALELAGLWWIEALAHEVDR